MVRIIKEITLKEIKTLQEKNPSEIDLAQFTLQLQSSIIINVSVGTGYSGLKIDYKNDDGTLEKLSMGDYIPRVFSESFHRFFSVNNLLFHRFTRSIYMPSDFRYKRNANRLRSHL